MSEVKKGHPKGLYILFGTEAAERFSFYTMRAILILYLTKVIFFDEALDEQVIRDSALELYATYLLLVYLSGLVGGYFADKVLGARKAIFLGGIVMGAGLFVMASPDLLYYGLALIIAGNGFFKPNISTIVSGLYEETDARRDSAFTIFYMGINLGAFFAIFSAGYSEKMGSVDPHSAAGWNIGFIVAGVAMIFSLLLFLAGQGLLGKAGFPPDREITESSRLNGRDWLDILLWSLGLAAVTVGFIFVWMIGLGPALEVVPGIVKILIGVALLVFACGGFAFTNRDNSREEWERIGAIIVLSVFVIFFWMGFEQAGGTMNLFAYEQTDRHIGSWEMPATWFQGVNPLFIIILAPVFSMMWTWNDKKKYGLSTPAKMGVGMIVLGLGFIVMYFGQQVADTAGKAGILWLVMVYLLHTLGELCLSPIGLSMVTKLSPVRRVSMMMGIWFACTAVADYLSGRLEAICHHYEIGLWLTLIAFSFGAGIVLLAITPLLKKWMHGKA